MESSSCGGFISQIITFSTEVCRKMLMLVENGFSVAYSEFSDSWIASIAGDPLTALREPKCVMSGLHRLVTI